MPDEFDDFDCQIQPEELGGYESYGESPEPYEDDRETWEENQLANEQWTEAEHFGCYEQSSDDWMDESDADW